MLGDSANALYTYYTHNQLVIRENYSIFFGGQLVTTGARSDGRGSASHITRPLLVVGWWLSLVAVCGGLEEAKVLFPHSIDSILV